MKQKTVIQLWGKQGCGKTTTIKFIREELEKKIEEKYPFDLPPAASKADLKKK